MMPHKRNIIVLKTIMFQIMFINPKRLKKCSSEKLVRIQVRPAFLLFVGKQGIQSLA